MDKEELKIQLRSMITASHYNQLPDDEFDKRVNGIVSLIVGEIRRELEKKFNLPNPIFDTVTIKDSNWQSFWDDIIGKGGRNDLAQR